MSIEIDGKKHFIGFFIYEDKIVNVMTAIWRNPDGTIEGSGRTRHLQDDKVFDSDDKKVWHSLVFKEDDDLAQGTTLEIYEKILSHHRDFVKQATLIAMGYGHKREDSHSWEVFVDDSDGEVVMECIKSLPCMNFKKVSKEEYEEAEEVVN